MRHLRLINKRVRRYYPGGPINGDDELTRLAAAAMVMAPAMSFPINGASALAEAGLKERARLAAGMSILGGIPPMPTSDIANSVLSGPTNPFIPNNLPKLNLVPGRVLFLPSKTIPKVRSEANAMTPEEYQQYMLNELKLREDWKNQIKNQKLLDIYNRRLQENINDVINLKARAIQIPVEYQDATPEYIPNVNPNLPINGHLHYAN